MKHKLLFFLQNEPKEIYHKKDEGKNSIVIHWRMNLQRKNQFDTINVADSHTKGR